MRKRWNIKRIACLTLATVMAMGTLVGCGKQGTSSQDDGKRKTLVVGLHKNLQFWTSMTFRLQSM